VVRALFFLPVLLSPLAVGYVFQALLAPDGALNTVVSALVGQPTSTAWLGSTTWTVLVVTLIHSWKWMGLSMLVYLAGLKAVPRDVIEAGVIDGASRFGAFWRIRFPLMAPSVTFNVTVALIGSMNSFDIVQATTAGGPAHTTEVLNVFIFRQFGQGLFAQATAMSLVLFVVTAALAVPVIAMLRRREQAL
jgi:ABC-type sugar transport system permease subunit